LLFEGTKLRNKIELAKFFSKKEKKSLWEAPLETPLTGPVEKKILPFGIFCVFLQSLIGIFLL